jgi:pilus assembly protein Flp/PilA
MDREPEMKSLICRFAEDESGATAIEYALIATLISIVSIVAMTAIGSNLNNKFNSVANALQ